MAINTDFLGTFYFRYLKKILTLCFIWELDNQKIKSLEENQNMMFY